MEPRSTDFLAYDCSIYIDAPPSRVFSLVGDLGTTLQWEGSGHIRSIEKASDGPVGIGTRYRSGERITMSYGALVEVVDYERDCRIRWIAKPIGEHVPYHRWQFEMVPEGTGTRLHHSVRAARAKGPMGLVQRLGYLFTKPEATIRPGMDRTLQNVKRLAEVDSSPSDTP